MDLGSAGGGKNAKAGEVDVAVPTEQKDINDIYTAELKRLREPAPVEEKKKSAAQKQEDYYKVRRWISTGHLVDIPATDIPNQYLADMGDNECRACSRYPVCPT
jgi:hypothetical protein